MNLSMGRELTSDIIIPIAMYFFNLLMGFRDSDSLATLSV